MNLKQMSTLTAVLFVAAVFTYIQENKRGSGLVEGSYFVKGLDVAKIQKISLEFAGDKKLNFVRDLNHFNIENHHSYPVAIEEVNDLIYKIANLQIREKVAEDVAEKDLEKYDLDAKKRKFRVEITDSEGKKTVSFSVGKGGKSGGNFLYRDSSKGVFLSRSSIHFNNDFKRYVNRKILDVNAEQIEKISLKSNATLEFSKKDGKFQLVKPDKKSFKEDKIKNYFSNFKNIRFEDFVPFADPIVSSLQFKNNIEIQLQSKLAYKLSLAKKGDEHYLRLNSFVRDLPNQIEIERDAGKEKLQNIAEMMKAKGDSSKFNVSHGSWIYKLSKSTFENWVKEDKEFFE